jgi:hypothetical protein
MGTHTVQSTTNVAVGTAQQIQSNCSGETQNVQNLDVTLNVNRCNGLHYVGGNSMDAKFACSNSSALSAINKAISATKASTQDSFLGYWGKENVASRSNAISEVSQQIVDTCSNVVKNKQQFTATINCFDSKDVFISTMNSADPFTACVLTQVSQAQNSADATASAALHDTLDWWVYLLIVLAIIVVVVIGVVAWKYAPAKKPASAGSSGAPAPAAPAAAPAATGGLWSVRRQAFTRGA